MDILYMHSKQIYNRKFRLFNEDGTENRNGPGYNINCRRVVITNPNIYSKKVDTVLKKEMKRHYTENTMEGRLNLFIQSFFI
jgi:hypothetical protein